MPRLVDANKLKQAIADNVYLVQDAFNSRDYGMFWTGGIEKIIDEESTVEAIPIAWIKEWANNWCDWNQEQLIEVLLRTWKKETEPGRHGRWIKDDTGAEYCSNCHEYPYDDGEYHIANWHSNFCPNCGAQMDEGNHGGL